MQQPIRSNLCKSRNLQKYLISFSIFDLTHLMMYVTTIKLEFGPSPAHLWACTFFKEKRVDPTLANFKFARAQKSMLITGMHEEI